MKLCPKCNKIQAHSEFPVRNRQGKEYVGTYCRKCRVKVTTEWNKANKQRSLEIKRKTDAKRADKIKEWRVAAYGKAAKGYHLKRTFGITLEDYNNMLAAQNHACAVCCKPATESTRALAVDHCHSTGRVRGLLCFRCNSAIGSLNDNPDTIIKAFNYLLKAAS